MENNFQILDWKILSNHFLYDFTYLSPTQDQFFSLDFTLKTLSSGTRFDKQIINETDLSLLKNKIKALYSKKSFHIFKNIHILESEKNLYIFNEGLCCFNLENILFNYLNKKIKFSLSETSLQFLAKEMIIAYIELRDFNTVRGIFSSSNILLSDVYVDINEDFYEQEPLKGGCNIKNFYKYKIELYKYIRQIRQQIFQKIDMLINPSSLEQEILKGVKFKIPLTPTDNYDLYKDYQEIKNRDIFDLGIVIYHLFSGNEPFNSKEDIDIGFYHIMLKEETTEEFLDFLRCLLKCNNDEEIFTNVQNHAFLVKPVKEMRRIKEKYPEGIYCSIYNDEVILDSVKLRERKEYIQRKNLEMKFPSYVDEEYLDTIYFSQIIQIQEELDIKHISLTEFSNN